MKRTNLNVYTFSVFWSRFHYLTNQHKLNRTACERLFNSINCMGKRRAIIDSVDRGIKVNAYEYLTIKINEL